MTLITHPKSTKPHKTVWKWSGDGEDEMVRIKVEKGYMTTSMAWKRKLENKARGEQ